MELSYARTGNCARKTWVDQSAVGWIYDRGMMRTVAVFGASQSVPGDGHYEEGVRCGRLLAECGFRVATGGYFGLMEAVSRGAAEAGGRVLGVTAPTIFPGRSSANAWLDEESPSVSLVDRIRELAEGTDASIALWGSLGTATELLVAWNLSYVAPFSDVPRKPIVAVGEPWATLIPLLEDRLATTAGLVTLTADVDEAAAVLRSRLG